MKKNNTSNINGATRVCAVITADASYSLSPRMHNLGYQELGIFGEFVYIGLSVAPSGLKDAINGIRALQNFRGLSIGTPHKLEVIKLIDRIEPAAKKIGAVNTVVIDRTRGKTKLIGTNTDWLGIVNPLKQRTQLKGKRVAVVGAAGAARAAAYGALHEGAKIKIFNRTPKNAKEIAHDFRAESGTLDNLSELSISDIIIHATHVGMDEHDKSIIPLKFINKKHIVFDIVYSLHIDRTHLAREAERIGANVIEGREMLLWQGVAQFELFTGRKAPVETMRSVLY